MKILWHFFPANLPNSIHCHRTKNFGTSTATWGWRDRPSADPEPRAPAGAACWCWTPVVWRPYAAAECARTPPRLALQRLQSGPDRQRLWWWQAPHLRPMCRRQRQCQCQGHHHQHHLHQYLLKSNNNKSIRMDDMERSYRMCARGTL